MRRDLDHAARIRVYLRMAEANLYEDGLIVRLRNEDGGIQMALLAKEDEEPIAVLPIDRAALASTLQGYSYQVAGDQVSVTLLPEETSVSLRIESNGRTQGRTRLSHEELRRVISEVT